MTSIAICLSELNSDFSSRTNIKPCQEENAYGLKLQSPFHPTSFYNRDTEIFYDDNEKVSLLSFIIHEEKIMTGTSDDLKFLNYENREIKRYLRIGDKKQAASHERKLVYLRKLHLNERYNNTSERFKMIWDPVLQDLCGNSNYTWIIKKPKNLCRLLAKLVRKIDRQFRRMYVSKNCTDQMFSMFCRKFTHIELVITKIEKKITTSWTEDFSENCPELSERDERSLEAFVNKIFDYDDDEEELTFTSNENANVSESNNETIQYISNTQNENNPPIHL